MKLSKEERLFILADSSKYDLSCSCSTKKADEHRRRMTDGTWLYPVQLASGGTGIMLKTLISNACSSDCKYCPFRHDGISNRCSLSPDEVASIFMNYLSKKKDLIGIFLSSGIVGTADHTMELLTASAEILRKKYHYRGYIHLKVIPGASRAAIDRALQLASAVSLNVEVPGAKYFSKLSNYKDFKRDIVNPLLYIAEQTSKDSQFRRVRCTTQFIVGATDEKDKEIVQYTSSIYSKLNFERVYFSAYQKPVEEDVFTLCDNYNSKELNREHRLYQTDFLIRKYGFNFEEIPFCSDGSLSLDKDPKQIWAELHPEFYPIKVNIASFEELLRIPGVGPLCAKKIVTLRKIHKLSSWVDVGLVGKNALKPMRYAVFS